MAHRLWNVLTELQSPEYEWVELSHSLNNESPIWSGMPEGSVNLGEVVFDWGNPILECQIQTFKFPGQFGTHIDFPGHFAQGKALSEEYSVESLVFPLVVIDVSLKVAENVDYAVTVEDIKAHEDQYGEIPNGAFVALRTDWSKRWPNMEALANADQEGAEHTPGWSIEALQYIYEVRQAAANGHETLDTDAGHLAVEAQDLACERYVLASGHIQVEVMTNLDKVAPVGALAIVTWPRIEGATGLPARVVAITPKKQ